MPPSRHSQFSKFLSGLLLILVGFLPQQSFGQEETVEDIMKGVMSSFSLPLRDLFRQEKETTWESFFHGFSGGVSFQHPLKKSSPRNESSQGSGSQGDRRANASISASLKYNPLSYWFASINFVRYLNKDLKAPWNPDFTYVFGYNDWHPYTVSLTYANYGGNRLKPNRSKGEKYTRFLEGAFSLGWKFPMPDVLENLFIVHETGGIGHSINYTLVPTYSDLASLSKKHFKQKFIFSTKYIIYKWWYANLSIHWYPISSQQQPWDPDFTYGFGYFDWHPFTISVQYNNYSGNRFPWKKQPSTSGKFNNGSFSISSSWVF